MMYLNANNLYEWAISQSLPSQEFCWLTPEIMKTIDVHFILVERETGL